MGTVSVLPGLPAPVAGQAAEPQNNIISPADHGIVGLTRRRWYKPDRLPARTKAWQPEMGVKLTEANLSLYEAELGIAAVCDDKNIRVGRIMGYNQHTNTFYVTGCRIKKRRPNRRQGNRVELDPTPTDFAVAGSEVSAAIVAARTIVGLPRLRREMSGR